MGQAIRVLLVDDHVLVRKGLRALLSTREDIEVVGEASDGMEAVARARELRPDVVLMDIQMPGCDGLTATGLIREEVPDARVVVLTYAEDDETLRAAVAGGAQGYLLKDAEPELFFASIRQAARGEVPVSGRVAARMFGYFRHPSAGSPSTSPAPASLESESLSSTASGLASPGPSSPGSATPVPPSLAPVSPAPSSPAPASLDRTSPVPASPAPVPPPRNQSRTGLSERERRVLELISRGATNRDVAAALDIAENTVKNHVRNILVKLQANNRAEAVACALREGLIGSIRCRLTDISRGTGRSDD